MGNVLSHKRNRIASQSQDRLPTELENYVVITNDTSIKEVSVLEFNPAKSCAICIGIGKQQNHKFLGNSLGDLPAKDAELLGKAFVTNLGIQKEHVDVYTSANKPEMCGKEAIKTLIVNYAHKVEEDGMIAFYFSGHVAACNDLDDSKGECVHVLVPADFAGDVKSGITAGDFVDWIQEANCKARHILIILDCCYAGEIGKKITSTVDVKPQIHVMCACAAKEVTLPMNILGSSIFCYFLLHILKEHQPKGRLALNEDMDKIAVFCQSFSSLLMCYSSEHGGLRSAMIQSEMYRSGSDETDNCDEIDGSSSDPHRVNRLLDLYDEKACKPPLHPVARQWLRSSEVQESLELLLSINPLPESLYNGIWCALFYSVSCIHLAYDRTHITERNLFITAAISLMSAIGYSYPDVNITAEQLTLGLKFYYLPINSEGISSSSIESLFVKLHVNCGISDQNTLNGQINLLSQWKPLSVT